MRFSSDVPIRIFNSSYWRRMFAHPKMMHYNRLIASVILFNLFFLYSLLIQLHKQKWAIGQAELDYISIAALINMSIANMCRNQYVVNAVIRSAINSPRTWSLSIRRRIAKIYHFGGIHVGGNMMATIWLCISAVSFTTAFSDKTQAISLSVVLISYVIVAVLIGMIVFALPSMRSRFHNRFERSHRFGAWTTLVLVWLQTLLFVNDQRGDAALYQALLTAPKFWVLAIMTGNAALPWFRLRRVPVRVERPSTHVAIVHYDYGLTPFAGSTITISRNPLLEWHSFANVPALSGRGFRSTISRAGDWTSNFIDHPPSHVWVKGIPTAGVGQVSKLFRRVVWVATGSGIGPTLPYLKDQSVPIYLIWSTRAPRSTYGDALVDEILSVQPDALIWDTDERGRPDLVQLVYEAYLRFNAEAVICNSNKKLTWQVVSAMESRGIPAYGPIWDS
jgi:hypothetical protein